MLRPWVMLKDKDQASFRCKRHYIYVDVVCCTRVVYLYCTVEEKQWIAREVLYDTTWVSFSISTFLTSTGNTIPWREIITFWKKLIACDVRMFLPCLQLVYLYDITSGTNSGTNDTKITLTSMNPCIVI